MPITKTNCVDCGAEFEYQGYKKKVRCAPCAYKRVEDSARQLRDKSGPFYDKWLVSMKLSTDNIEQQADKMRERYIAGRKWRADTL